MKKSLWGLAVAAAMAAPSALLAQVAAPTEFKPQEEVAPVIEAPADGPNTGGLTLTGGVDYTTAYFFRGYNQEDTGLILQPYVTITAALVETDSFALNGYVGTWNSFHENKTLAVSGPSTWYESDLFGGLDFVFGDLTIGTVYTFYTYPNGAFETIQEVGFKIAYDDTDFFGERGFDIALKPYAAIYLETSDGNGTEDTYLELGMGPSFAFGDVTLTVPVIFGLSVDDYYVDADGDNETFGYFSFGLFASVPLGEPGRFGAWSLTGGLQYIQLFADGLEAANDNGENNELLGKVGVSFAY